MDIVTEKKLEACVKSPKESLLQHMFGLIAAQYVYSKLFQQLKFQLLCHDLLFQCRFIFGSCLIFQKNYDINYL